MILRKAAICVFNVIGLVLFGMIGVAWISHGNTGPGFLLVFAALGCLISLILNIKAIIKLREEGYRD